MFLTTFFLAFLQLSGFAISTNDFQSPQDDAPLDVKRALTIAATRTTSSAFTSTPTTANCPKTFRLYIFAGSFGNFYIDVNGTGQYPSSKDSTIAARFTIRNNRLVTLTAPGGIATVPKSTNKNGNYLTSTLDTIHYSPVNVAFDQNCQLQFTKKVSAASTLDTVYSIDGVLYLGSKDNPPENGFALASFLQVDGTAT